MIIISLLLFHSFGDLSSSLKKLNFKHIIIHVAYTMSPDVLVRRGFVAVIASESFLPIEGEDESLSGRPLLAS